MNPIFEKNKELAPLTTFGIKATAKLYKEYSSLKELQSILASDEFKENEYLHIGGGSNLLFVTDYDGLILHSAIKGITRYDKDEETAFAICGAGERWDDFVDWCISENLAGLENLAGIPGEAGASAIQNIGAYGVEAADYIHNIECLDTINNKVVTLKGSDCGYGYRESRFKNEWRGRYIVLRVSYRLKKCNLASHLDYAPIKEFVENLGRVPTLREMADEVIRIRNSKLPDPRLLGNAGSFFKNPVVNRHFFEEVVKSEHPDIPFYKTTREDRVKLPAAWLIDKCGLKGEKSGGAQIYPGQCLVIVNMGEATAEDVVDLANTVVERVKEKFSISLSPEVNYIDTRTEITILGSGTSKGVPEIGCRCATCLSSDERDKRLRASVVVKTRGVKLLIDVSPDFRQQALREDITDPDAALITHVHYDHVGGLDDLRPFCVNGDVPLYMKKDVSEVLHRRLDYCFKENPYPGVPIFKVHEIDSTPFYIKGVKITPIELYHGKLPILGYRIGEFAYLTDCKTIEDEELEKLKGLKVLIINALRDKPHFAHLSLSEALELIKKINPEKAYLTHFSHEIGLHEELSARLPENVIAAYDGMKIVFD